MVPLSPVGAAPVHGPVAPSYAPARFGEVSRAQAASRVPAAAPPTSAPTLARTVLEHVERARERLDCVLAAAQRGRTFTAQELLAVQSLAYRYSQTVEVASKVVEQAVQSVKQAVQTQV